MASYTNITTSPEPEDDPRGGVPPMGELFNDPNARLVWAALEALDEAQLHLVLAHLQQKVLLPDVRGGVHATRIARAVGALREAADALRVQQGLTALDTIQLTEDEYERLRRVHPRAGWPPAPTLRRWMGGGWNDALRQAQLKPVFTGDALVREIGPTFTREELIQCIVDYSHERDEKVPTIRGVMLWAKRPDVLARPGRRPRSLGPFNRVFESWADALAAAGLVQAESGAGPVENSTWATVRPTSAYGYSDEQLYAALREVHGRLGRSPKLMEYNRERQRIFDEVASSGKAPRAFPSSAVIQNRFPTWDEALVGAGLEAARGRQQPRRNGGRRGGPRITDEEILADIRDAYADIGDPFTAKAYNAWRGRQMEKDPGRQLLRPIARYCTVWNRFGSWREAVRRAREEQPRTDGTEDADNCNGAEQA
jgi:hypothetical protein